MLYFLKLKNIKTLECDIPLIILKRESNYLLFSKKIKNWQCSLYTVLSVLNFNFFLCVFSTTEACFFFVQNGIVFITKRCTNYLTETIRLDFIAMGHV